MLETLWSPSIFVESKHRKKGAIFDNLTLVSVSGCRQLLLLTPRGMAPHESETFPSSKVHFEADDDHAGSKLLVLQIRWQALG